LPAPGHVTVETLKVTVTGGGLRRLPARLRLSAGTARSLPPTVRVLWARRTRRARRSTTYALLLVVVNVAPRQSTTRAGLAANGPPGYGNVLSGSGIANFEGLADVALFFGSPVAADFIREQESIARDAAAAKEHASAIAAFNADRATSQNAKKIGATLADLFAGAGAGHLEFDQPKADKSLDTGHYDDGHAFGWNVRSSRDEKRVLSDLAALTEGRADQLVADFERDMGADINGDGTIGSAQACPRASPSATTDRFRSSALPGRDICTTVGPPVVTGGP
jgi:hypothetical protein